MMTKTLAVTLMAALGLLSAVSNIAFGQDEGMPKRDRAKVEKLVVKVMQDVVSQNPRYYKSVSDLQEEIDNLQEDKDAPKVLSYVEDWQSMLIEGQLSAKPPTGLSTNSRWPSKPYELTSLPGRKVFVCLPKDYKKIKPIPVIVALHPEIADKSDIEDSIEEWATKTFDKTFLETCALVIPINETDSKWAAEDNFILRSLAETILWNFSYDPARLFLYGEDSVSEEVVRVGANIPSMFSGLILTAPAPEDLPLSNLSNNKICLVGEAAAAYSDALEKSGVPHDKVADLAGIPEWIMTTTKSFYPSKVSLRTNRSEYGAAYWIMAPSLSLSGGKDIAQIDAMYDSSTNEIVIKGNDKVTDLFIFLNDQMVNMDKPIKVIVNDKVEFEGTKSRSLMKLLDLAKQPIHGNMGAIFTNRIDISLK